MRHDVRVEGPAFRLRPVEVGDAAAILELRLDPDRARYIGETAPSVDAQTAWLQAYFERDGDFYWAVERLDGATLEGFVGIYDVAGDTAEWGRWVLRPGSLAAPETAWLVHHAAFHSLGLTTLLSRTLAENRTVVAFHSRYGAETVRIVPAHARIGGVDHDAVECRVTVEDWATSGPQLHAMAERAATLLRRTAEQPRR